MPFFKSHVKQWFKFISQRDFAFFDWQFATQYKINFQFAWIYLSRNSKTSLLLRVEVGLLLAG